MNHFDISEQFVHRLRVVLSAVENIYDIGRLVNRGSHCAIHNILVLYVLLSIKL